MNDITNPEEFEHCVMCGDRTCIPKSMPIDWREHYEIGLGQLCPACAKDIPYEATQTAPLSYEQILLAVEQSRKEKNSKEPCPASFPADPSPRDN